MIDEPAVQCETLDAPCFRHHDWPMLNEAMAREAPMTAGMDPALCRDDPMPGNFMPGPDGSIMLIDGEHGSTNDLRRDLASGSARCVLPRHGRWK